MHDYIVSYNFLTTIAYVRDIYDIHLQVGCNFLPPGLSIIWVLYIE